MRHGFVLDRPSLAIVDYRHSGRQATDEITINDDRLAAVVTRYDAVPPRYDEAHFKRALIGDPVLPTGDRIEIKFVEDGDADRREAAHLLTLFPAWCAGRLRSVLPAFFCSARGYVELIRQPAALLAQWGMDRPTGYTILGRTDLAVPSRGQSDVEPAVPVEPFPPELSSAILPDEVRASLSGAPAEVIEAARLAAILYREPIRSGPSPRAYETFVSLPLLERIMKLRTGDHAVMCAGFRDLWLALAAASPDMGPVRQVGAYSFYPALGDLIPYSHAVAEFWIESERRWVLIDPWFGFMLRRDGRFLGVADLLEPIRDPTQIEIVAVVPRVERFLLNKRADEESWDRFSGPVSQIAPAMTPKLNGAVYEPGYLQYFKAVHYGAATDG